MTEDERQTLLDEEHLRLLAVGYFVGAGATAFFSLIGLLYLVMGAMMALGPGMPARGGQPAPAAVGWMIALVGFALFAFLVLLALLKLVAGLRIRKRKSKVFCLVVAALTCLGIPWGTVLGVFTFIVLGRPSVARRFEEPGAGGAPPPPRKETAAAPVAPPPVIEA